MGRPEKESTAQIVVIGESGVGKTCFTDMFLEGKPFIYYSAIGPDMRSRNLTISNETWSLHLMDLSSTVLRDPDPTFHSQFFEDALGKADGIVLLYDITSGESFEKVTDDAYIYTWMCRQLEKSAGERYLTGRQRFGCVLVGNKADIVSADPEKRQVGAKMAEQWAHSQGFRHFEVTSNKRTEVEDSVEALVKSIKLAKKQDADEIEEKKIRDREKEKELKKTQRSKGSIGNKLKLAFRTSKTGS
ncbi:P-loop containing nucleoside triphosphate hydrolase protein [Cucurbitaria berberidis CBS 394.84]|uniref:P-loop containing nucleoside triphosphate hydrolase protein n=1 Tax=Cucurbitaria berberidis CBS 394.84 TaxID=1168544 RepID=A0A9P4GLM7_9PLEO|nr:P-loop containing nucleoside triphosphate hydrolase protein [Cucurbitaria berberidis CBS 394.84]KAF1847606.1 P-loop containing nucleoside triphosphate hydrolase protein [Cucurbitaria berberidis CBS 394.84]